MFNIWDRIEENVFADDVTNALAKFFPDDPPRFLARTPHGYHDTALIRSEAKDAGFSRVAIETKAERSSSILAASCGHRLLSGNSSSQRNPGQRRGKAGSCNRLRRIRDCRQTWKRRGRRQNSGARSSGCGVVEEIEFMLERRPPQCIHRPRLRARRSLPPDQNPRPKCLPVGSADCDPGAPFDDAPSALLEAEAAMK